MVLNDKFAITILISFVCCLPITSQQLTEQNLLLQPSELLTGDLSGNGNGVFINQIGDNNEVELLQSSDEASLLKNLTRLLQSGTDNRAWIIQNGGGNELALIQYGEENLYKILNQGYDNNIVIIQQGEENRIHQQLIASNQNNIEFVQQGNNNTIVQILEGVSGGNYTIRQVGDGLKVYIRQSAY